MENKWNNGGLKQEKYEKHMWKHDENWWFKQAKVVEDDDLTTAKVGEHEMLTNNTNYWDLPSGKQT